VAGESLGAMGLRTAVWLALFIGMRRSGRATRTR